MTVLRAYETHTPKQLAPSEVKAVSLPFFKNILFKHSLKKFKKYASGREENRLFRSNMFSITRSIFRRVGVILEGQEISDITLKVSERKQTYFDYQNETPPSHFLSLGENMIEEVDNAQTESSAIRGVSAGVVSGRVKVMKEFEMPSKIDFEILITRHTDPGWTALIALSKGLIIEHGGVLSHASIVARELGIPAVIGVRGATDLYKDGQKVEIDGSTGNIKVI
jgi:pyruvate,water dikinase